MANPMFGNKVSPNQVTQPNNPVNDSYKRYKRGYNKFDYSRASFCTERFADINVIDVIDCVENDKIPFANKHEIRSFTLKSPIMFDLIKKKSYFMVDKQAILPINWKRVYKQPNKGDDVADDVNCFAPNFLYYVAQAHSSLPLSGITYNSYHCTIYMKWILFLESLFSNGSLLSTMNCHLSSYLRYRNSLGVYDARFSFDRLFDEIFSSISFDYISVIIPDLGDAVFVTNVRENSNITNVVSVHQLLDLMRTFPSFRLNVSNVSSFISSVQEFFQRITFEGIKYDDFGINFQFPIAYQLVCRQFFTNDSVDNVIDAKEFIENQKAIVTNVLDFSYPSRRWPYFSYNGSDVEYDVFSGYIINELVRTISDTRFFELTSDVDNALSFFDDWYAYFHALLGFRKSLRYGDYFVGGRLLPYAPADVTAPIVSNGVSALDMTRSILMQRFANSVERIKNTWQDYISGVMDGVTPPDPELPRFLASQTSRVNGFEVENTAQDQGNIVTLLKSTDSNYMYEVEVGEPCIIIGLSTYQVAGVYSKTTERFFLHADRFDMFNKFMQNIGDQDIKDFERSASQKPTWPFAYTPRHMEYKQRYHIASGGFVDHLPGYAFIRDNNESGNNVDQIDDTLSPYFIRNRNGEFDRFYESFSGYSLAGYFHFILRYDNICKPSRQMEYSPSIL